MANLEKPYRDIDELIGKTFNNWTVIERISGGLFIMRCKCGEERKKKSSQVINGKSKQCLRCYKKERRDIKKLLIDKHNIVGKTFGKWLVLQYLGDGVYEAKCECDYITKKKTHELMTLKSLQCERCRRKEVRCGKDNILRGSSINLMLPKWSNSIYSIRKEDLDEQ